MSRIFPLFCVVWLISFSAKAALFQTETFFLNNGMEVIVVENRRAPVITHMVWYKTGAIDDVAGQGGTAHLLEHMMFKGTKKVPDGAFSKIVETNGGEENAFTGNDFTAYYQNIAYDRLELVMFLEADRMKNLRLSPQDFPAERQVVTEERLMRYDNNPQTLFAERKKKMLWGEHPYARPVIGTKKELATLTLDNLRAFYHDHYAPDNAVLVVAGDINAAELRPLAEKYYGAIPPLRHPVEKRVFTPPYPVKTTLEMAHPQVKINTVTHDFVVPSYTAENKRPAYAFAVLGEILGATHYGKLYKELVVKRGLAAYAGADYDGFALDKGTFRLFAAAEKNVSPKKLVAALNGVLDKLNDTLNTTDVEDAKKRLVADMEYINDSPETAANIVGMTRALGLPTNEISQWPDAVAAVTKNDVLDALNYLKNAPQITGILTPENKYK